MERIKKRIQATVTSETSNIGVDIACDKEETKDLLEQAEVPIPKGDIIRTEKRYKRSCRLCWLPFSY